MGGAWLTSSPSIQPTTGSVADRFLRAAERAGVSITTIRSSTQTPSCSGSARRGGNGCSRSGGIHDLHHRLEQLAFTPRDKNAPPLETYTTTSTEHGIVFHATPEFIRWFRRTYSIAGHENSARLPAPGAPNKGVGGTSERMSQFLTS